MILHSGGALGSDAAFQTIGKHMLGMKGLKAEQYHIYPHFTPFGNTLIDPKEAPEADKYLTEVNERFLHRTFPPQSPYTLSLLRRNYFVVKNADAVFAIATLDKDSIAGGTAWGIFLGLLTNKPVYYCDQNNPIWTQIILKDDKIHFSPVSLEDIDIPENFAGIGTRRINDKGISAIQHFYQTILNKQNEKTI